MFSVGSIGGFHPLKIEVLQNRQVLYDFDIEVQDMHATPRGELYAITTGQEPQFIHWNGAGWDTLAAPNPLLISLHHDLEGHILGVSRFNQSFSIEKWDGITWQTIYADSLGEFSAAPYSISMSDIPQFGLMVSGDFQHRESLILNQQAFLKDGTWQNPFWSSEGLGFSGGGPATMVSNGTALFVGGTFSKAGLISTAAIARLENDAWQPLGDGLDGSVHALALGIDGALYAGGLFDNSGDQALNNVGRWDGVRWHSLYRFLELIAQ